MYVLSVGSEHSTSNANLEIEIGEKSLEILQS